MAKKTKIKIQMKASDKKVVQDTIDVAKRRTRLILRMVVNTDMPVGDALALAYITGINDLSASANRTRTAGKKSRG